MYKPPVSPSVAGCGPLSSTPTFSVFSTTPRSSPRSYGSNASSFTPSTTPSSTSSLSSSHKAPSHLSVHRPNRSSSLQPVSTKSTPIPQEGADQAFLSPFSTPSTPSGTTPSSFHLRPRFSPYFSPTLHIHEEEVIPTPSPLDGNNTTEDNNDNNSSLDSNSFGGTSININSGSSRLSTELHVKSPLLSKGGEPIDFEATEKTGGSSFEQVILWLNLVIMFVSYFAFSALAPFWPDVATKCGLGATMIGFVTSAYPLGMFCSSLMTGYVIPVVGTKNILIVALVLASIFSVVFGSIPWFMCGLYDVSLIFGVFLVVRFIQGMMSGILETCIMFSISAFFPDRIGQILAYQELAIGVACMIGPLIGGLMYNLLHFFWTFIVFAVFFIVLLSLVFLFFPRVAAKDPSKNTGEGKEDEGGSLLAIMSGPLAFSLFVLFVTAVLNAFMVPILPLYLDDSFGWGPLLSGAVFGVSSLFYGVTATTVGHVTDNMKIVTSGPYKVCYSIGFAVQALGYYLLGPLPFESITSPTTVFISFCLIGIGFAFCLIPTLPDMQLCTAITAGVDSDANKSVISGVWQATYAIAMALGAPLAGILYEQIGFFDSSLVCCFLALITALPSLIFGLSFKKH